MMKRHFIKAFLLMAACCAIFIPASQAGLIGTSPTGQVVIKELNNPVYLFVPQDYDGSRPYTLVFLIPNAGEYADKLLEEWTETAKKKNFIVASPELKYHLDDVPYDNDKWLLKVKREVMGRYQIGNVFLFGKGDGAHYAAYLGLKFPQEFAGAGLVDGSWVGPFDGLVRPSGRASKQIPFYVSLHGQDPKAVQLVKNKAYQLTAKGYQVYLEGTEKEEKVDPAEVKGRAFDWLQKKSESWSQTVDKTEKSKKEKFIRWLDEFVSAPAHT